MENRTNDVWDLNPERKVKAAYSVILDSEIQRSKMVQNKPALQNKVPL